MAMLVAGRTGPAEHPLNGLTMAPLSGDSLLRMEERTLRIGFGIKGSSQREIGLPQLLGFQPPLNRCQPIPFGQFISNQVFRLNHLLCISRSKSSCKAAQSGLSGFVGLTRGTAPWRPLLEGSLMGGRRAGATFLLS